MTATANKSRNIFGWHERPPTATDADLIAKYGAANLTGDPELVAHDEGLSLRTVLRLQRKLGLRKALNTPRKFGPLGRSRKIVTSPAETDRWVQRAMRQFEL
jgi:hypothetical protein